MITNRGKDIIARYLAGQTLSAFSHFAIGTGPKPTTDGYESPAILTKTNLDFEALRVPITSSSVISEGGVTNLVFSATLPSQSRYEFTEIGLFSAESNSLLTTAQDALLFVFSEDEGWTRESSLEIVSTTLASGTDITTTDGVTFIPAADPVILTPNRYTQRSRIGEDALLIKGGYCTLVDDVSPAPDLFVRSAAHIAIEGTPINLSTARPDDEIKFAFSIMRSQYVDISTPPSTGIKIRVDFTHGSEYAALEQEIPAVGLSTIVPASTALCPNGYFVVSKKIKDLTFSSGFDWSAANGVKVWAEVEDTTPANYFISPDALRFESKNDNNSTYGLVAYSPVSNLDGAPQVKSYGLESQVEYKIPLEVV